MKKRILALIGLGIACTLYLALVGFVWWGIWNRRKV